MSADRELLELGAKAAGMPIGFKDGWNWHSKGPAGACMYKAPARDLVEAWNPLTDDGDALRLAVRLRIDVLQYSGHVLDAGEKEFVEAVHCERDYINLPGAFEDLGDDEFAATRRAIVRAAAEIGRDMP